MMFNIIKIVQHSNEGASSHEGIIASLMTALLLEIVLYILIVDVCIVLQQLFIKARLIQGFKIDFNRFQFALQASGDDLCVEYIREKFIYFIGKLGIIFRQLCDERMVNKANVKIGKMTNDRFLTIYNLFYQDFEAQLSLMLLLQMYFFLLLNKNNFFSIHLRLLIIILRLQGLVYFYNIFISIHILLGLVQAHVIFGLEEIQYFLGFKIYFQASFIDFCFDFLYGFFVFGIEENFLLRFVIMLALDILLLLFIKDPLEFNSGLENSIKIHPVFCQKCHTFPFRQDYLSRAFFVQGRYIKIIRFGEILAIFEMEQGQSQLQEIEIQGCLLDSLIEFQFVREGTFDIVQLCDQSCEFAIEGDEMGLFDVLEDELGVFVEVVGVDLH